MVAGSSPVSLLRLVVAQLVEHLRSSLRLLVPLFYNKWAGSSVGIDLLNECVFFGGLAQLVERCPCKAEAGGSNPPTSTKDLYWLFLD